MLFIHKYGITKVPIGIDEYLVKCPCCESHSWADVIIMSNYSHYWFIPFYPTDKDATVFCKKCGLKREGVPFNENLINNYREVKHQFRHPWYTYIGVVIVVTPFLGLLIFAIVKAFSS